MLTESHYFVRQVSSGFVRPGSKIAGYFRWASPLKILSPGTAKLGTSATVYVDMKARIIYKYESGLVGPGEAGLIAGLSWIQQHCLLIDRYCETSSPSSQLVQCEFRFSENKSSLRVASGISIPVLIWTNTAIWKGQMERRAKIRHGK